MLVKDRKTFSFRIRAPLVSIHDLTYTDTVQISHKQSMRAQHYGKQCKMLVQLVSRFGFVQPPDEK